MYASIYESLFLTNNHVVLRPRSIFSLFGILHISLLPGVQGQLLVQELPATCGVSLGGLGVPNGHPLCCEEPLNANRTSSVNPTGADSDFGAKTKTESVRHAGGAISKRAS